MIKKLFLCAALVGAVGLTSCVDDVESASVTAVRNAKAEQLKAAAEADKARAEADIIMANAKMKAAETAAAAQAALDEKVKAEAEYQKAQAAYWQAQAAYQQALTDAKNAETEQKKAEAELQLEKLKAEIAKTQADAAYLQAQADEKAANAAKLQAELKKLIAEYERDILLANKQAEEYKQQLDKLVAQANYNKIAALVKTYNDAVDALYGVQKSLTEKELLLSQLKAGVVTETEYWKLQQKLENVNINFNKELILAKQAEITILEADYDYKTAQAAIPAVKEQLATAKTTASEAATKAYNAAADKIQAIYDVTSSAYVAAANVLAPATSSATQPSYTVATATTWSQGGKDVVLVPQLEISKFDKSLTSSVPVEVVGNYSVSVKTPDPDNASATVTNYIPVFTDKAKAQPVNLTAVIGDAGSSTNPKPENFEPKQILTTYDVQSASEYYTLIGKNYESLITIANGQVTAIKAGQQIVNDSISAAQTLLTTLKAKKAVYDEKDADLKAAEKAKTDATDPTADELAALDDAIAKAKDAKTAAEKEVVKVMTTILANTNLSVTGHTFANPMTVDNDYTAVFNAQKSSISGAQTTKNSVDLARSTAEKYATTISTNLTTMANDAAGFVELINKMNAADKANAEADLASQVAEANQKILEAQLTAYETIVNSTDPTSIAKQISDLNNEIKEAKDDITESEKKIAKYQLYIDGVFGNIGNNPGNQVNLEKSIADAEVEIDQYKAKVAALKDQVAAAKAALDAALAAE